MLKYFCRTSTQQKIFNPKIHTTKISPFTVIQKVILTLLSFAVCYLVKFKTPIKCYSLVCTMNNHFLGLHCISNSLTANLFLGLSAALNFSSTLQHWSWDVRIQLIFVSVSSKLNEPVLLPDLTPVS